MHTLERMKTIHKTALVVDEIQPNLFWVEYPGLVLIVSVRHLIAARPEDEWLLVCGYDVGSIKASHSDFIKKALNELNLNYKEYKNRSELVAELKKRIKKYS